MVVQMVVQLVPLSGINENHSLFYNTDNQLVIKVVKVQVGPQKRDNSFRKSLHFVKDFFFIKVISA